MADVHDTVSVTNPPEDRDVEAGEAGTVVHCFDETSPVVEFSDEDGSLRALVTFDAADLEVMDKRSPAGSDT